jgi:hypothetical protein
LSKPVCQRPLTIQKKAAMRMNGMKVAVSRMLSRANHLVANASVGVFPSVQAPAEPIVWRRVTQQRLDSALAQGPWRPLFDENEVLNVQQLDDDPRTLATN